MTSSPVVCSFESRRAEEMRKLIERHGGTALIAPSMKEVPLRDNPEGLKGIRRLVAGRADLLILMTGVGTTAMLDLARTASLEQRLLERMADIPLIVRGPKPAAVLHRLGLQPAARAESPNTWKEILRAIDSAGLSVQGRTVAIQEYGIPARELAGALGERGASVLSIPVYRWELPDDVEPLKTAIQATVDGKTDILLFTSAQQIRHVALIAQQNGQWDTWKVRIPFTGSIGPTCSDALRAEGIQVDFEANPPKMGSLVRGALEQYRQA